MPLFRRLHGFPEDWTYSFESNPDPEQFVEVGESAAPAPEPEPVEADEADTKDDE